MVLSQNLPSTLCGNEEQWREGEETKKKLKILQQMKEFFTWSNVLIIFELGLL